MLPFDQFEVLTFDCYGTLIDWETGIVSALGRILSAHNKHLTTDQILELFAELESEVEAGEYMTYRSVLQTVLQGFGSRLGFVPGRNELDSFGASVRDWLPFSDSPGALQRLKDKFKLAIISNVDDDLFAFSAQYLAIDFNWIITAQQIGSYKPSLRNFHYAIERMGIPQEKILHIAQSLFHDIAPAKKIGLATVWINRRHDKEGFGATPPAEATPDMEVPDLQKLAAMVEKHS